MARGKKGKQPLGVVLRNRRKDAGHSQSAVARAIGCTTGNVSQIERLKWQPTVEYLRAFAAFYGVKVDDLLKEAA